MASFDFADALGIDRYSLHPQMQRVRERGLVEKIRTPGVKQVSWRLTEAAIEPPPPPPLPANVVDDGGRPRFAPGDWPPDFVPTLHRTFGLPDEPRWAAKAQAIAERDAKRFRSSK